MTRRTASLDARGERRMLPSEAQTHLGGVPDAQVNRERSQFYTPQWLADRVAKWACVNETPRYVLEPAAGRGALVAAIKRAVPRVFVHAWDIDRANCDALDLMIDRAYGDVFYGNFLTLASDGTYDLCITNPPYEDNQDVRFIEHALDCSQRVVGIFQSRILHSKGRAAFWRHHDITRLAVLSERPRFGGDQSGKTDFIVAEIVRRASARLQDELTPMHMQWW